ncbi:hypothetical protein GCM10010269_59910 [Streptomyces humidus]|uniref:Uncharacterized protein n=1 Tax=Streptomyces humidus TaxID=52259 RepID=A0A918L602_9ACTN|nr:hypothetical protein [Streptomyces humidus]GGS12651.1 hypothetical protein GCM10010269_59910 [Streptomyces humidus]
MAAESGGESERDPLEAFIDEVFEEMVREAGVPHGGTSGRLGKDPLAAALVEAAMASLSNPQPSPSSDLERVLFAQTLATALAESLAPALAEALASEIMKVLTHHADAKSGGENRTVGASGRERRGSGERKS